MGTLEMYLGLILMDRDGTVDRPKINSRTALADVGLKMTADLTLHTAWESDRNAAIYRLCD